MRSIRCTGPQKYGSYVVTLEKPKDEAEKTSVIWDAISELIESFKKEKIYPKWSSIKILVNEEHNVMQIPLDWYDENESAHAPIPYMLTVALRLEGEPHG